MFVRVKSQDIRKGDKLRYIGRGFRVNDKDGSELCSQNAEYDVEVLQITPHHITLRMTVDQTTIRRMCIWGPQPYNWSIQRWDLDNGIEKLYKECYV